MNIHNSQLSVVIPAKNEADSIGVVVRKIYELLPGVEVVVVNDGSEDNTASLAEAAGATVINHNYSRGNGAAIKEGARYVSRQYILFMDADGQHDILEFHKLESHMTTGVEMVVGARPFEGQASIWRYLANAFYNWFASKVVGHRIPDLTSGFRLVRRSSFLKFLYLYPNGFSYPTTSTMAFFRAGYGVEYVEIDVNRRAGKSHIRPAMDGMRFLLIIFKVASLYSPLKIFFPVATFQFLLGISYYVFTWLEHGRFTNMAATLILSGITTFLIGLVSEQITALMYKDTDSSS